jgi:hypothetical protein
VPGEDSSSRLALDLAMNIRAPADIADAYGMTPQELSDLIKSDAQLRLQIREYKQVWSNPMNAVERIRIKAAVMVEDSLLDLWKIMTNEEQSPAVRLDTHRHLSKLADVEPRKDAGDQGPKFSVTINVPGTTEPMTIDATLDDAALDDADPLEARAPLGACAAGA